MRLVRHAQASFGSADYDCLSALGEEQAQRLGAWLAGDASRYSAVVRGSLRRHAQTWAAIEAAFAAAALPLPPLRVDPDWNEFDHEPIVRAYAAGHRDLAADPGIAAGDRRALRAFWEAALRAWRRGELDHAVEHTWTEFGERVAAARARLDAAHGTVLVVTSGGPMWRCVQAALGVDDDALDALNLRLRNSAISEFALERSRWRMLDWDAVPHLAAHQDRHLHSHY